MFCFLLFQAARCCCQLLHCPSQSVLCWQYSFTVKNASDVAVAAPNLQTSIIKNVITYVVLWKQLNDAFYCWWMNTHSHIETHTHTHSAAKCPLRAQMVSHEALVQESHSAPWTEPSVLTVQKLRLDQCLHFSIGGIGNQSKINKQ